jgi:HPt (histidine-containing phosphotransfer) domain-containing protein
MELIDTFLDDAPNQIAELHQALVDENSEVFRYAAHTLKSNSANFGADSLAEKAKVLETMGIEGNFEGAVVKLEQLEAAYDQVQHALKTWQHDT